MKPSSHITHFPDPVFQFYNDTDYKTLLEVTQYFRFKPLVYLDYNEQTNRIYDYKELKNNEIVIKNPLYKFIEDKKSIYDLDRSEVDINFESDRIELYFHSIGRDRKYYYFLPKEKFYLYDQISYEGLYSNDTLVTIREFPRIFKPTLNDIRRSEHIVKFDNSYTQINFNHYA